MGGAAEDAQDCYAAAGAIANEAITSVRTVAAFSNEEYEVKRYAFHLRAAMNFGVSYHTSVLYDHIILMSELMVVIK
jgi:ABC-type transport system involved in Fe-S cluster assembly fused permease/ATPase subunit